MKIIGLILLSLVCLGSIRAESQADLNIDSFKSFKLSESRLQETIRTIRTLYKADPRLLRCLEASQQAWLVYRDKQMAMIFPLLNEDPNAYGTMFSLCWSTWMTKLTNQRTAELQVWIDGIEEGEVCAGSIRITQPVAGN
jgi:uncharacterized protein YecT (DUF1311 family)